MSVLDQIRELDKQKDQLLKQAKDEALRKANAALKDLAELGFNYRLTQSDAPTRTGSRRSGIRDDLTSLIGKHPQGISRADILANMDVKGDKTGERSVSNALSALKKQGVLNHADDGNYTVAAT